MRAPSRSTIVATGAQASGAAAVVADTYRHSGCGEHLTWLGWCGWAVVVVAFLASAVTVALDLRERRWIVLVPALAALLALSAAVGMTVLGTMVRSLCGFEIEL